MAAPFLLSLLAYFIFAVFMVWKDERSEKLVLEKRLTPKLKLDFDANSDGIIRTPIKIQGIDVLGSLILEDSHGTYIRIRLTALTNTTVRACYVLITEIEKQDQSGNFSAIKMPQIHKDF